MDDQGLFDGLVKEYEQWFIDHQPVYESEVRMLRHCAGSFERGLEVGAGSGLFAGRLGIREGIDPSAEMIKLAGLRDVNMSQGKAENLPYSDVSFDLVLMVTSVCFMDDIQKAFKESRRVLKDDGKLVIGFVDSDSPLGRIYLKNKEKSPFYKDAVFYSTGQIVRLLKDNGFCVGEIRQTAFGNLDEIKDIQEHRKGHGEGGFTGITAFKKLSSVCSSS